MNAEEFEKIFDRVVADCRATLGLKAGEYAKNDDRMHNFKIAANLNEETPEQALWGMVTKHIVSVRDMVLSGESYPDAVWEEKLRDYLNYGILLRALSIDMGRCIPNVPPTLIRT